MSTFNTSVLGGRTTDAHCKEIDRSRLPSHRRISGSAKFLPPPKIRRKNYGHRKCRQICRIWRAAAKTSTNLWLSLTFYRA